MRTIATLLVLVFAAGCSQKSAPDDSLDGDADYLTDGQEAALGTDPANPDSDGDGYLDGDEVLAGTNPRDATSVIYRGGWPFQRNKDAITDPGYTGSPVIGALVPRFVAVDQFGDEVDLYDFSGHEKPIVLDLSAGWCGACQEMAAWLEGKPSAFPVAPEIAGIPALVSSGSIYWVTVYFQDASSTPADAVDAAAWYATFPNPHVPVMADTSQAMFDWLWPGSYPNLQVVEPDMTLRVYNRFDYMPALQSLVQ